MSQNDNLFHPLHTGTMGRSVANFVRGFLPTRRRSVASRWGGKNPLTNLHRPCVWSLLGPVLANIFMCHFEECWLTNNQFRPSIWFRYVDDTFSLFDSRDTASRFLDFLNSRHPNIKFTMELEENREIPFLDVCIEGYLTTHFQLLYNVKRLSLVFTPSGSPLLLGSIRSISSEHLPIVACASVQNPLYCSPLYPISRDPCFKMVIREALTVTEV